MLSVSLCEYIQWEDLVDYEVIESEKLGLCQILWTSLELAVIRRKKMKFFFLLT
jgi:hypothetical protein